MWILCKRTAKKERNIWGQNWKEINGKTKFKTNKDKIFFFFFWREETNWKREMMGIWWVNGVFFFFDIFNLKFSFMQTCGKMEKHRFDSTFFFSFIWNISNNEQRLLFYHRLNYYTFNPFYCFHLIHSIKIGRWNSFKSCKKQKQKYNTIRNKMRWIWIAAPIT